MDEAEAVELITGLEGEAARVKENLSKRRRPLIVEFSGTPKAGKSTIINVLRLFLARNNINPFVLTERASISPIQDKNHLFFNVWTGCSTLAQMLDAAQDNSAYDVVIMDRGIFDALVWMRWLQDSQGQLTAEDRAVIQAFFLLPHWRDRIDLLYVMEVSPEESLKREFAGQVTRKPGKIMNSKTIAQFNDALARTLAEQAAVFGNRLLKVDTTGKEPMETGYEVVKTTLEALDRATV